MDSDPFAQPKRGLRPDQCSFYHRMEIPGLETTVFDWDLIGDEAAYLGNFDFRKRRVLEFGAASGGLTFWIERQGADVVAMDLSPDVTRTSWDMLLPPEADAELARREMAAGVARLNNGFWYAHEFYRSQARMVHGTAYCVPSSIGRFDVVTLCAILLHLRDPLGALEHALSFTDEAVIITDLVPFELSPEERDRHLAVFFPGRRFTPFGGGTWWHMSPQIYRTYLEMRGFEVAEPTFGFFRHQHGTYEMFHLVARRRRP
jgi:SAM-dependent methyltransferase